MKQKNGFTLVEMLVAITILASIAVLGWRGLDAIVRARVALTSELERTRGMQLAFAQMQSDCAHIVRRSTLPNRAPLVVMQNRFILVRTVFIDDQPSRVQVVAYHLKDGVLSRQESIATRDLNTLDTLWISAVNEPDANQVVSLQSGVSSMAIRLWINDDIGWRQPGIDVTSANSGNPNSDANYPTGLKVSLQLNGAASVVTKIFLLGSV